MKVIHIPNWWDSIRAILALVLSITYCLGVVAIKIPKIELEGLYKLAELALIFYFVLKKRTENNEGGQK